MLGAKVGRQGKPGDPGPKGERGAPGVDGIGVEDITTEDYAFVVALTNGKTITFDLRGMFERCDQERAR